MPLRSVAGAEMSPHAPAPLDPWEARWAPYDEATYAAVLSLLQPTDVVLDIGAGDLRLAVRMAAVVRQVYAWELQPEVLAHAPRPLPPNLHAAVVDARLAPVPAGITVAVLLMRHCTHYATYVARLRAAGCSRLITNARWGMGIELIDLGPGVPFDSVKLGWYACRRCGAVGFVGTDATRLTADLVDQAADVEGCPACQPSTAEDR